MADIFISYSSRHREPTQNLATLLQAHGYSVWWDQDLESRGPYYTQIRQALDEARVVVVIWSDGATQSNYVYAEATRAYAAGKLVQVRPTELPVSEIPEPFNIYHLDDLDFDNPQRILTSIAAAMAGKPVATRVSLSELFEKQFGYECIQARQEPLVGEDVAIGPADLLQAQYGLVPYVDTGGVRQKLVDWCQADDRTVAGRLVYGAGGLGKTRLLAEVAAILRSAGWYAGFVAEVAPNAGEREVRLRQQAIQQAVFDANHAGTLLILDYAEARQQEIQWLTKCLDARRKVALPLVRVVLLARGAGAWWEYLIERSDEMRRTFLDRTGKPIITELAPLPAGRDRVRFFDECVRVFAPLVERMAAEGMFPRHDGGPPHPHVLQRIETDHALGRPLALQMEALLHLASSTLETEEGGTEALLRRVLALERRHWERVIGPLDQSREFDIRRGISQVSLVGGAVSASEAKQLLMRDGFYERRAPEQARPVVEALQRVYASSDGRISSIQPDLLGEHEVSQTADDQLVAGCLGWINDQSPEARRERLSALLTILQRATQREHGEPAVRAVEQRLEWLIKHHAIPVAPHLIEVARSTPGTLVQVIERLLPALPTDAIQALNAAMPLMDVRLLDFALAISERFVAVTADILSGIAPAKREAASVLQHAAALGEHSIRLAAVSRHAEALKAAQQSVELFSWLAEARSRSYLPELASAKNNLSNRLASVARSSEALVAAKEADRIYEILVEVDVRRFSHDRARCKRTLATRLSELGNLNEALAADRVAVEAARAMGEDATVESRAELARTLINSAELYKLADRFGDSDVLNGEAAEILRSLSLDDPHAYLPDLALCLNNTGTSLIERERGADALPFLIEAAGFYDTFIEHGRSHFLPQQALARNNVAMAYLKMNRMEEAAEEARKAEQIYRVLSAKEDCAVLLANCLETRAQICAAVSSWQESKELLAEALTLIRPVVENNRGAHAKLLGLILKNYHDCCAKLGERPDRDLSLTSGRRHFLNWRWQ